MQMLSIYQHYAIVRHYEVDINNVGMFLPLLIYQIDSDVEIELTETSDTNSCKTISAAEKIIQNNLDSLVKSHAQAQKRLVEAENLIENFMVNIQNDENLNILPELNINSTPHNNLVNVVETIRKHFLLEPPALIAQFAEVFANIYESLLKTSEIYESFISQTKEKIQKYLEFYKKVC